MAKKHRIAVIPGDGIGKEVVPEGVQVLDAVARRFGIDFAYDHFDWSVDHYMKHGAMMPADCRPVTMLVIAVGSSGISPNDS